MTTLTSTGFRDAAAMLFDSAILGLYVAVVSIPATAVVQGEVSLQLALFTGLFAGAPQALRHIIKQRNLTLNGEA